MTPYIKTTIPDDVLCLFEAIGGAVRNVPDIDLGKNSCGEQIILDCHMIARAIGRIFGLRVVDGHYAHCSHSWLETIDRRWVIDPYPVMTFPGPLLLDARNGILPGRTLYQRTKRLAKQLPFSSPEFRRSVRRIAKAIEKTLNG